MHVIYYGDPILYVAIVSLQFKHTTNTFQSNCIYLTTCINPTSISHFVRFIYTMCFTKLVCFDIKFTTTVLPLTQALQDALPQADVVMAQQA